MNRTFAFTTLAVFLTGTLLLRRGHADPHHVVTARQVNGKWRYQQNEFRIKALGKQRLRVSFDGTYEYQPPQGPSAHIGEASGVAHIIGDTATFVPEAGENCTITLRFARGTLVASQNAGSGECGFGHNVSVNGTYYKVKARRR